MFWVTDHTQSGWLGFFRYRRKKTKARQCLNRCGCTRVQSTRFKNTQLRNCGISGCRKKTFEYRNVFLTTTICIFQTHQYCNQWISDPGFFFRQFFFKLTIHRILPRASDRACDIWLEPISKMHLTPNSFVESLLKMLTWYGLSLLAR